MANWLEEAEQRQKRHQHDPESLSQKILEKKEGIKENYSRNHQAYDQFIAQLNNYVQRVNNLPPEERGAFGKIKSTTKKTRLDNHLAIFASSQRQNKTKFLFFFPLLKDEHSKNIRVIYLCVSKNLGMIDVEIRETQLIRTRLKEKTKPEKVIFPDAKEQNIHRHKHIHHQIEPETGDGKFHVLYTFEIAKLSNDIAIEIIEWLAFKREITEISIYESIDDDQKIFLGRES